ncbi:MAG: hemagglutinin, partial [Chloroflexota bacterium]
MTALAADGPFTIDGSVPDTGTANLPDIFGSTKELGPLNSNTTKIGVIHSDGLPTLGLTNPNAQVDLRQAWLATARDSSTSHDWLYFAWERDSNSGSGFIAYEFMKNAAPAGCAYDTATDAQLTANCNPWANRTSGDFMILWDQQGGSKDLYLRTWSGTAPNLTLGAPALLNSNVSQAQYSADGFFGEAAVDLTATIFGGSTACRTFANTIPSTVTGNSDTADYKDTILKTAPPITNCTSTTVTTPKIVTSTTPDPDTTAAIPAGGASIGTGVLAVADSAVVSLTGGTATPAGSVAFSLCKVDSPGLCTTGGTSVGSTDLSGTAYPVTVQSPTAYVTSAGRYCWRATFSGDSANGISGSSDSR